MKALIISVLTATSLIGTFAMSNSSASAGEVYNREVNQQNRIYNGVKNGQISKTEYKHLENCEAKINAQRLADLKKNHGHLTASEYRQLNREENRVSAVIYRDRHN